MSGKSARKWRQAHPHKMLAYDSKRRARRRGVPHTLTSDDVKDLLDSGGWSCVYCEMPVGSFAGGLQPLSATLDRLIPERGYTEENTVVACHRCNSEKSEHTVESLRAWADRIEAVITRKNPKGIT